MKVNWLGQRQELFPECETELAFLSNLAGFPNVCKLHTVLEDSMCKVIVMQYCENGSLAQILAKRKKFTELEVRCIGSTVLKLVDKLENEYILHRDICLEHLLIDQQGNI